MNADGKWNLVLFVKVNGIHKIFDNSEAILTVRTLQVIKCHEFESGSRISPSDSRRNCCNCDILLTIHLENYENRKKTIINIH